MDSAQVNDYINKVRKGLDSLHGEVITNLIDEALKNRKIGMNQLDKSVTNYIMENTGKAKSGIAIIRHGDVLNFATVCGQEIPVMHQSADKIATDILSGNNVYLHGKAGTGKTYLAKQIAEIKLGRGYELITCSQWTSPINIIGGETITGFRQGTLINAWKKGKLLILDELPKLDANTAGLLNEALAQTGEANSSCPLHYTGKLGIGTRVYTMTEGKNKRFVEGVWGVGEKTRNDIEGTDGDSYFYTFFWIQKVSEEEGEIVSIEENFVELKKDQPVERVFKAGDSVLKFVTVTDGSGKKQPRHPFFGCIATGNTDMKTLTNDYSGNNRQDYSLVDRFAGSYYLIDYKSSESAEEKLIFSHVRTMCGILRKTIDAANVVESISLRTMLNFNRVFIAEMLARIGSPLAIQGIDFKDIKKLNDSLDSFISTLNDDLKKTLNSDVALQNLRKPADQNAFIKEFQCMFEINVYDKSRVARKEIDGKKVDVATCVTKP